MEAMLEKIDLKKVDISSWKTYRFEEIAHKISQTVKPEEANVDVYVGLEHLDAHDIHIRRKGVPSDVKGGKLRCSPGDVIFGKRRAYQRKAAIVDFEGICSAHAFVFRAKPEMIDPKLFPFFLHSDQFMHRMVDISVGGLSPTINWGNLKNQKFLLPPREEQAKIAELLWAMEEVIEREIALKESLHTTYNALVDNLFSLTNENWRYIKLSKLASINEQSLKSNTPPDYAFKYLDIASIIEPKVVGELQTIKFSESPSRARRIIKDNSIVLSLVRPYHKSFVYIEKGEGVIASTGTGVINVNDEKLSRLLFHQFFSKRFILFCENRMTGTNYPAITPTDLKDFKIAMPENEREIEVQSDKLDALENNISKSKTQIQQSKALQKSLINQMF